MLPYLFRPAFPCCARRNYLTTMPAGAVSRNLEPSGLCRAQNPKPPAFAGRAPIRIELLKWIRSSMSRMMETRHLNSPIVASFGFSQKLLAGFISRLRRICLEVSCLREGANSLGPRYGLASHLSSSLVVLDWIIRTGNQRPSAGGHLLSS